MSNLTGGIAQLIANLSERLQMMELKNDSLRDNPDVIWSRAVTSAWCPSALLQNTEPMDDGDRRILCMAGVDLRF